MPSIVGDAPGAPGGRAPLCEVVSYNRGMKTPAYTRAQALPAILSQRIAVLDGAMGTMIQRFKLGEAQYPRRGLQRPRWFEGHASRISHAT